MSDKIFDIILIGATGFTGRRAAKYLKEHAPELNIGIAARNESRLSSLASQLGYSTSSTFVVDTLNKETVDKVAAIAKVIISTAGPFSLYGEQVIASCVEHGTHYLDITGEVDFIKSMMNKYGDLAVKNKCLLIPFSGFDSVPADIATYLISKKFENPETLQIKAYYKTKGGLNGGTIASMLNKFEAGDSKNSRNPRLIMQENGQKLAPPKGAHAFGYNSDINRWSAPFIMGAINSKVVYRSASLWKDLGSPYAASISYSEHSSFGKWYNPFSFIALSTLLISLQLLGPFAWFRALIKKVAPNPGEGPSEHSIENGFFSLKAIAKDGIKDYKTLSMYYPGDPSNKATVFFLCESALTLVQNLDDLPHRFGFLTSTTALGEPLINRLETKGLIIS
ncbi:MAG: saccharopine dehydrogenase NADP-binding domain-containing protein [Balneolaceae bacterium]